MIALGLLMPPGSSRPRAFLAAGSAGEGFGAVVDCFDGVLPLLFFRFLLLPSAPSKSRIRRTNSLIDFARVGFPCLLTGSQGVSLCGAKEEMAFL